MVINVRVHGSLHHFVWVASQAYFQAANLTGSLEDGILKVHAFHEQTHSNAQRVKSNSWKKLTFCLSKLDFHDVRAANRGASANQ